MNTEPSYWAWEPTLDRRHRQVWVYLTRGRMTGTPWSGSEFVECIRRGVGNIDKPTLWYSKSIFTAYFPLHPRNPDQPPRWHEVWETQLVLEKLPDDIDETLVYPVHAEPESLRVPDRFMPVRVIADFATIKAAEDARAAALERGRNLVDWPPRTYERTLQRRPFGRGAQLHVDLMSVERDRVESILPQANDLMTFLEGLGGKMRAPLREMP